MDDCIVIYKAVSIINMAAMTKKSIVAEKHRDIIAMYKNFSRSSIC